MGTVRFKGAKPNKLGNYEEGELKIYSFGNKEVACAQLPDVDYGFVDPILANNSWETIRAVCEVEDAANYWALGDSKTIKTNNLTREFRIADMSGLYGKHVVFASWTRSETTKAWDAGNVNEYANADVITDLAEGGDYYAEFVDAELGAQLTDTTVKVAKGGEDSTLVEVAGKLFLPAEKEITATRGFSVQTEFDALTTYAYFLVNDNNDFRIRHKASAPTGTSGIVWWTRSPYSGSTGSVVRVKGDGDIGGISASGTYFGVAPCFAF